MRVDSQFEAAAVSGGGSRATAFAIAQRRWEERLSRRHTLSDATKLSSVAKRIFVELSSGRADDRRRGGEETYLNHACKYLRNVCSQSLSHLLTLTLAHTFPNPLRFVCASRSVRCSSPTQISPLPLTHPSVSVCGSSPLLAELEETACPQPTEPQNQIFSYAETVTFSSDHVAGHPENNPYSANDDALIVDALADVLFGDETSESFADFTAPFAVEVGAHGKDEEEADGQSVHVVGPTVPSHFYDSDHENALVATVVEDAYSKHQEAAANVPDDAALVDRFVADFLDPCFADQPKAFSPSVPAHVAAPMHRGNAGGGAAEGREPLKTTRTVAVASFGRGGGGLSVPVVPSVPQTSSPFSSFLPIAVPATPAAGFEASSFGSGMPALRPSDFKSKMEYRRVVAIPRYLAKRKRRQWNKESTYTTRTDAAKRRGRINGKFRRSETFVSVRELTK